MGTQTVPMFELESGDHLSRAEFHRRYCACSDIKRAELIKGVVYVTSPVRIAVHAVPHAQLISWLQVYQAKHPELYVADNGTVWLEDKTEVQPDAMLWRDEPGGPVLNAQGYLEGAPHLVAEVAASSASYDLHDKKDAYQQAGVHEYLVWQTRDAMLDWFRLVDGEYIWVEPDEEGTIESDQFPGLRLRVPKLLAGDMAAVLVGLEPPPLIGRPRPENA